MERGASIPRGRAHRHPDRAVLRTVNGLLTTRLSIAPFIVTLGTLGIIRGLDADHLQRPAGAPDPARIFVPGRGNRAGRAVRAVDSGGCAPC